MDMLEVDLIMFDLDGTLADTKGDLATAVNLTLQDFGLALKPPEVIYTYVGDGVRHLLQRSFDGSKEGVLEQAVEAFRKHYLTHLVDTTCLYPGIESVLEHFKEKKRAVITNKPEEYTLKLINGLKAQHHFDLIIGSNGVYPLKPDPGMILSALEQLGVSSERALMIGDSVNDIRASRCAGVKVCAVGYGLGDSGLLKKENPDYFCEEIIEIKEWVK